MRKKPKGQRIAPHHPRGLAAMSPERRREIARKGGQAAQARGLQSRVEPQLPVDILGVYMYLPNQTQ